MLGLYLDFRHGLLLAEAELLLSFVVLRLHGVIAGGAIASMDHLLLGSDVDLNLSLRL